MTHPQTQDDEALVEVARKAIGQVKTWDGDTFAHHHTRDELTAAATAALTALRNHEGRKG